MSWTFLVPVGEVYLTKAVNNEFKVDRVTLVHRDKLPRIRKRLGLGAPVSEIKKSKRWARQFFEDEDAWAFAVVRHRGTPEEVTNRCLKLIREEICILSVSQLGYHRRKHMGPIVAPSEIANSYVTYLAVSSQDSASFINPFMRTAPRNQVILDWRWKNYQDKMFFTKLLKTLRGETEVDTGWRYELRRASVIIGESVGANDLLKSFVWNMVALEMLLTRQGDKLQQMLPRRAEALLGWIGFWQLEDYEARIEDVYKKRSQLLHSGQRDNITQDDLVFTDHLLLNLLINLVRHPTLFRSKDDVIAFSERVAAERVLGIKPRVRPKTLLFTRPSSTRAGE